MGFGRRIRGIAARTCGRFEQRDIWSCVAGGRGVGKERSGGLGRTHGVASRRGIGDDRHSGGGSAGGGWGASGIYDGAVAGYACGYRGAKKCSEWDVEEN